MAEMRFTKEHEWALVEGDIATVGITNHAQEQLGDVVFVELPEVGKVLKKDEQFAVVESVKAASEVYAPLSGEVLELNADLAGAPDLVNVSAEDKGWFVKIKLKNLDEFETLMNKQEYEAFVKEEH